MLSKIVDTVKAMIWPERKLPSFLALRDEVTTPPVKMSRAEFTLAMIACARKCGCDIMQACGFTANAAIEAAWGRSFRANDPFGWKMTQEHAAWYKQHYGKDPPWWSGKGHVKGGDAAWCFYRAFDSLDQSTGEWLVHFVPRPGGEAPYPAYKACGEVFWSGGDWFPHLVAAGYKGDKTRQNPGPTVKEFDEVVREVQTIFAQAILGVETDCKWGPHSTDACKAWQIVHGLPATGELTELTLRGLAGEHVSLPPPPMPEHA